MDENVKNRLDEHEERLRVLEALTGGRQVVLKKHVEPCGAVPKDPGPLNIGACVLPTGHAGPHQDRPGVLKSPVLVELDAPPAEETYATYKPTGPLDVQADSWIEAGAVPGLAKSLSKAIMSAGGSNHFDLAVVRAPGVHAGTSIGVRDGLVDFQAPAVDMFEVQLEPAMERLLAKMLIQDADEREARAREGA